MPPSHRAANPSLRNALLALIGLLAATLVLLVAAGPALAGSGGVAPSSNTTTKGSSGKAKSQGLTTVKQKRKYRRLWRKVKRRDRRWARKTAVCESGKDPKAIGGGGDFRGAFMFLWESWQNAPKSPGGDPIAYTYRTQAVVAVALKKQLGTAPWPVCG